jgi:hypothetical protein
MVAEPIGTIRTRRTGNSSHGRPARVSCVVKVTHHGLHHKRWKAAARVAWEHHFGAIPDGHQVYHRDRNAENNDPSNLILVGEDRLDVIFSLCPEAARNQRINRSRAVAKSNRDRARVAGSQVNPRKWYLALPLSKAVVWWPCRTRRAATKLDHDAVAELCRRDPLVILERRDRFATRSSGAELFVPGHPVEAVQGAALLSGGGVDSRYEGFVRLIPDERPSRRLVVHWGDLEPIPPDEYPVPTFSGVEQPGSSRGP